MALLDFLKRKTEKAKKPEKSAKVSAVKKEKTEKKAEKKEVQPFVSPAKSAGPKVRKEKFSYEVIKNPHISEKASYLAEQNQYVFEILPNYNKKEVKDAVEGIYGVDVLSVNMIKIPAKKRRLGRTEGFRKAYKKAVVKIKEGQKIEIL
jgi:large subunit ribosomal protein L23